MSAMVIEWAPFRIKRGVAEATLLAAADTALYRAKRSGRDQVVAAGELIGSA